MMDSSLLHLQLNTGVGEFSLFPLPLISGILNEIFVINCGSGAVADLDKDLIEVT